jgi:hypothetical protein
LSLTSWDTILTTGLSDTIEWPVVANALKAVMTLQAGRVTKFEIKEI